MSSGLCGCRVQQRPFFYFPYQAGIDFSLITEEHKKGMGIFEPNAAQNVTGEKTWAREPSLNTSIIYLEFKM